MSTNHPRISLAHALGAPEIIWPHPFLRITRLSLCLFAALLQLVDQPLNAAQIARRLKLSRPMVRPAIEKGRRIMAGLAREAKTEPAWAPTPCFNPAGYWSDFIRMFAAKFYPKRYGGGRLTEYENSVTIYTGK